MASVQAAWTTGISSTGSTNIVRRMPRIRTKPVLVQGLLDGRDLGVAHPRPGGQVDGRRVGGVQPDQVAGGLDHA